MPYSGDPSTSIQNEVRFELGDTDPTQELVTDDEIDYALLKEGNDILLAAARLADHLAGLYSRQVDSKNLSLSVSASQRSESFARLARKLRARAGVVESEDGRLAVSAEISAGGLSEAEKEASRDDTDLVQPFFSRGMDDNPEAGDDSVIGE